MAHVSRLIVGAGFGLSSLAVAGSKLAPSRQAEVKITIGFISYGDAIDGKVHKEGLWSKDETRRMPVLIENDSGHPLDFFTDGNMWGDQTLTFDVTTADGELHKVSNSQTFYTANFPGIARLQPG